MERYLNRLMLQTATIVDRYELSMPDVSQMLQSTPPSPLEPEPPLTPPLMSLRRVDDREGMTRHFLPLLRYMFSDRVVITPREQFTVIAKDLSKSAHRRVTGQQARRYFIDWLVWQLPKIEQLAAGLPISRLPPHELDVMSTSFRLLVRDLHILDGREIPTEYLDEPMRELERVRDRSVTKAELRAHYTRWACEAHIGTRPHPELSGKDRCKLWHIFLGIEEVYEDEWWDESRKPKCVPDVAFRLALEEFDGTKFPHMTLDEVRWYYDCWRIFRWDGRD